MRLVQADPAAANTSLLATGDAEEGFLSDEPPRLNGELETINQALREAEAQPPQAEPIELDRVGQALRRIDPLWDVLFPAGRERIVRLLLEDLIEAILRGDEPARLRLEKLRKNLPVQWAKQRQHWRSEV